eukprot:TRINITY_DN2321_c0_g1_i1.p1 TRINITY_DN2321_c0_g1~~TRINITY_DN2321_c0_g1_i1.p1  ORF type:complete len:415 (+),score=70.35 TRINITY_DN2321_c0_g1_i1:102-1346(+)
MSLALLISVLAILFTILYIRYGILPVFLAKHKRNLGYLWNPSELKALVDFKKQKPPQVPTNLTPDETFCYQKLMAVSRSFALVTLELQEPLKLTICVFYLVLRALDTIEDDMTHPVDEKSDQLRAFYKRLSEPGWNTKKINKIYGKGEERDLLEQYEKVISTYRTLDIQFQNVISDICQKMGAGMAEFLTKDVASVADYELYCHYVAGLVGEGLSALFSRSKLEAPKLEEEKELSNSMGLFLQKCNIIRDYLEDISEQPPRVFYPKEIWSLYGQHLEDFKLHKNKENALLLLNHMITDALKHATDSLEYLNLLNNPSVFKFCAIPQIMAIATLSACYNNYDVFRYAVKIRKGETVKIIMTCKNYNQVLNHFDRYAKEIGKKISGSRNKELEKILFDLQAKIREKLSNLKLYQKC